MKREKPRPTFPKRAVITAGMPYGNKSLHFGHIGGVFVHADVYARFLKDRIGKDNVIFVSGTDCYGSPIVASHKKYLEETGEDISIEAYVKAFYMDQKSVLEAYEVAPSLYASSAFDESGRMHEQVSNHLFEALYQEGHLVKGVAPQFFDEVENVFLNGRQVIGKCPVDGCTSEKAYADECGLGHQYVPSELIDPISTLSGTTPILKPVENWQFNLQEYQATLAKMVETMSRQGKMRSNVKKTIEEFLKAPAIYVTRKEVEKLTEQNVDLPYSELIDEPKKNSITYVFKDLDERDHARAILEAAGVRFRTGKTLVPFRLSGNIEWGVPVPEKDGLKDLTFWVWPESLWAPVSFTKTYLKASGHAVSDWKKWWIDPESQVYQFIGEDNVYFYGIAEMGMLLAYLGIAPDDVNAIEHVNFPILVANCHLLFFDAKASSSGAIKPPMAGELLTHYTSDQLRMHFLSLGLSRKSVKFAPKPYDPDADSEAQDIVLKDGNLLSHVFNRLIRSCFYTTQTYFNNELPQREVSEEIRTLVRDAVMEYEFEMGAREFHKVIYILDECIRKLSKYWSKYMKLADDAEDSDARTQVVADMFYAVKTVLILLHPIVPNSCELVRERMGLPEDIWSWETILDPMPHVNINPIPPRFDFFQRG